ncbi:MAG: potassium-transporting ATPase subunit F [Gaiellaceae bacterium]
MYDRWRRPPGPGSFGIGGGADVRSRRPRDRRSLLRLRLRRAVGAGTRLMSAADVFGLVISVAVLVYLLYALLRGERL